MDILENVINFIADIGNPIVVFIEKHYKFLIFAPIIIIAFFVGKWMGWINI